MSTGFADPSAAEPSGFAPTAPSATLTPVPPGERIVTLDILRGIALLGVIVANVWLWFSGIALLMPGIRSELIRLTPDAIVFSAIGALVSGKAVSTFAFLFGLGFAIQGLRAAERGVRAAPVQLRRFGVLLLIGAVHGFLLWYGDILMLYALLGMVLLLMRRLRDRPLLIVAGVLLAGLPLVMSAVPLAMTVFGDGFPAPDLAAMGEENAARLAAFSGGVYAEVLAANLGMLRFMYASPQTVAWTISTLGLFLLGLYAGRHGFFADVAAHRAGFRRVALWGLAIGLPCSIGLSATFLVFGPEAVNATPALILMQGALATFGMAPLAFGYIATATLLLQRPAWQRRLAPFAPVGRMALTNYLMQTVLCLLIFYGYGAGLIGRVGSTVALAIALLVYGAQVAWSPWWLARFRFGPAEWLWRSLTYGTLQPMRVAAPLSGLPAAESPPA
jgi:uncharacterized protein